jgi:hypothetical protein
VSSSKKFLLGKVEVVPTQEETAPRLKRTNSDGAIRPNIERPSLRRTNSAAAILSNKEQAVDAGLTTLQKVAGMAAFTVILGAFAWGASKS